jgi:hypothetical protein
MAKRELKQTLVVGDDARRKPDRRYLQRVRCRLSFANVTNATTKEERASLFNEIDEMVESEGHRWGTVLSDLEKGGPDPSFSFLFFSK